MNNEAAKKITRARTALILDEPFFGTLALRLRMTENNAQPTATVDGVTMKYNADYINAITHEECKGLICHEVLHVANGHTWRQGAREHKRCNIAADYAINPIVIDAGFRLPGEPLISPMFYGRSMEQ